MTTSPPQSHLGEARRHPSQQRMHSSSLCATSCAMLTADESNHLAAGTLHLHCSVTCVPYVTDRPTLSLDNRSVRILHTFTILIESNALKAHICSMKRDTYQQYDHSFNTANTVM